MDSSITTQDNRIPNFPKTPFFNRMLCNPLPVSKISNVHYSKNSF